MMRQLKLDYRDPCMFGEEIQSLMYGFFARNRSTFRDMIKDLGHLYWRRFLVTFKAHCMNIQLIANPYDLGSSYRNVIIEGFNYLDMQILIGEENVVKMEEFIEDTAVLASYRHLMNNLDAKSHSKDPFCVRECRDVFKKVFGEPSKGPFTKVKAWIFLSIYLRAAAALIVTLRRWMDSTVIIKHDDPDYWTPPPCDIFLFYSFSDEVFKLLPSQTTHRSPKITRKEVTMKDYQYFGVGAIEKFRPKPPEKDKSKGKPKETKIIKVTKPDSCMILELTTVPDLLFKNNNWGIVSFKLVRHSHSGPCIHWRPFYKDESDKQVEDMIFSIMELLTSEERKRYLHGLVQEKNRQKQSQDLLQEHFTLDYFSDGGKPGVPPLHELCHPPIEIKKTYVLKRCSKCNQIEKEKRTFKICKICYDRMQVRFRSYCSRDCQVSDWPRHRREHKELERVRCLLEEEDSKEAWENELVQYINGYYKTEDTVRAPVRRAKSVTSSQKSQECSDSS
ncbi:uncharacterized protein LOC117302182 [Asterias rubens]|uniref:uncharacterized protein LOC117302182 n=1 Tax=Asterias rubens TaxID=7604 RepID=UPI00145599C2|nr:uncharacterized protein LOC117302182 [Asterias rubens]